MAPILIAYSVGLVLGIIVGIAGFIFAAKKYYKMQTFDREQSIAEWRLMSETFQLEQARQALEAERENLESVRLALQDEARRLYAHEVA